MNSLGGRAEDRRVGPDHPAADPVDPAGLRGALASRLAGLATPTVQDVTGSPERAPNGGGTAISQMPIPAAKAPREHISHPVDIHVGARVRLRRQLLGMSQKDLAAALGITFQQVQKFERGRNRIAAGRLHDMSGALDVPISFFFDTLPSEFGGRARLPRGMPPTWVGEEMGNDRMQHRETLNLMRAYHAVPGQALRLRILDLVRSLAPAA
ncbi:helix-turn-helix domain-containing protein [Roseomonas sp. CAU 1739]|uniref:helix-turn-helix domain-containing protein n=1 Tax=Roseomonas sp. CAU 1739 TaxID=3140364 RepID=UPI00325B544B